MTEAVKITRDGLWCPRKKCQQSKTCQYAHNCKSMTHADAKLAQEKWEADKAVRKAEAAERERQERYERRHRMMSYENKLTAAGIDLGELIELIEARQNGTY